MLSTTAPTPSPVTVAFTPYAAARALSAAAATVSFQLFCSDEAPLISPVSSLRASPPSAFSFGVTATATSTRPSSDTANRRRWLLASNLSTSSAESSRPLHASFMAEYMVESSFSISSRNVSRPAVLPKPSSMFTLDVSLASSGARVTMGGGLFACAPRKTKR